MNRVITYEEAATIIDQFLDGSCGEWDWDNFTSIEHHDALIESVRKRCLTIPDDYPSREEGHYCSAKGLDALRALARELRMTKVPNQPPQPTRPTGG